MKKTRIFSLILSSIALIVILSSFASCSASVSGDYMPEASPEMGEDVNLGLGDANIDQEDGEYQRKIIKTARINAETRQFEESIARIEELCKSAGVWKEYNLQ